MSTEKKNIPNFLDRVYHNRKDGTVLAFDDVEVFIRFDDGEEKWVPFEKVRLTRRGKDWAYMEDGSRLPSLKGV